MSKSIITLIILLLFTSILQSKMLVFHLAQPSKYEGRPTTVAIDSGKIVSVIQYGDYTQIEVERFGPNSFILVREKLEVVIEMINEANHD